MLRVLYVDDDEHMRFAVEYAMKTAGIQVVSADTLAQARELLKAGLFDMALLDINLRQEEKGFHLVPDLAELNIPYMFLTVFDQESAWALYGEDISGIILPKGGQGMRMDLVTKILDMVNRRAVRA